MFDFKDKVVLITGAGKGAGSILAKAFAERGAVVAANDVSPVNVDEVVSQITSRGGKAKAYIDDIAKKVAVQTLIRNVEDDLGPIDILVNHAAVEPHIPLLDMDEWDWHRTLDVNLTGAFLMTQSAGRVMRARGRGVILHIVPEAGQGTGNEAGAYAASMAGLVKLTEIANREMSPDGVHAYAVENRGPDKIVDAVLSLLNQE